MWSSFENAAVLGDSRAVGFSFHEFLPEDRVMAQGGGKITDLPQYYDQLKALNPKAVFLCFGLNDVGIGLWPTGEEYAAECDKQIAALQAELPDATIYLLSLIHIYCDRGSAVFGTRCSRKEDRSEIQSDKAGGG